MTRNEAVQAVKGALQTPVTVGASSPGVSELDLGGILDLLQNFDFGRILDILKWVSVFVPQLAPVIPVVERLLPILLDILQAFGEVEAKSITAEAVT